ncbi:hypothetical protein HUU51_04500 [Candidatus Gracilibacteria bacterium]|nr:hypothetical protein [Candidatus Gracilibacteria bacterium]
MKRTKREENSIVISSVSFVSLTIVLIILFITYILPGFREIEAYKQESLSLFGDYKRVLKEGVSHDEFKANVESVLPKTDDSKGTEENDYLGEVLKSITKDFYNNNFNNKTEENFEVFIDKLSKKYIDTTSFDSKTEVVSKILPIYSEAVSDLGDNSLSDYKFVNYIESIAETFNFTYKDAIGISDVKLLEEYTSIIGDSSLDTNIFYIPLTMELTGSKGSIIDFLYFIENVGKIKVDEETGNVGLDYDLNKDFSDFRSKTLKGQTKVEDYGIFANQIFDISSISFEDYIDSSFNLQENGITFIDYLKKSQGTEKIKVKVSLRFYVKGIPLFKIEKQIKDFIADFNKLRGEVQKVMSSEGTGASMKVNELNLTLNQMQMTIISNIQKSLSTKVGINEAYKQVIKYTSVLEEYKAILK